jgi:hypothetical protein
MSAEHNTLFDPRVPGKLLLLTKGLMVGTRPACFCCVVKQSGRLYNYLPSQPTLRVYTVVHRAAERSRFTEETKMLATSKFGKKLSNAATVLANACIGVPFSALSNAVQTAAYLGLSYLGVMVATSCARELLSLYAGSPQRRW